MSAHEPLDRGQAQDTIDSTSAPPRKRHGCVFYGCLTLLILLVVLAIAVYLGFRFLMRKIDAYTDVRPIAIPRVEVSPQRMNELEREVEAINEAKPAGEVPPTLVLDSDDINALIARQPQLRDHLFVKVIKDRVKGEVSFPLRMLGIPWLPDRYFNGAATLNVALRDGALRLIVEQVEVKGQPLPENAINQLPLQNLVEEIRKDPRYAGQVEKLERVEVKDGKVYITATLEKLERVEVKDGKVYITARRRPAETPSEPEPDKAEAEPDSPDPAPEP